MGKRISYYSSKKFSLTEDDFAWLQNALVESFESIQNIETKSNLWIEGEVFTSVRRLAAGHKKYNIQEMFKGDLKHFGSCFSFGLKEKERVRLFNMFKKIQRRYYRPSGEYNTPVEAVKSEPTVDDLDQTLTEARGIILRARRIVSESERVRSDIDKVSDFIEGNS